MIEILQKKMTKDTWIKGLYVNGRSFCLKGAVTRYIPQSQRLKVDSLIMSAIQELYHNIDYNCIEAFNDASSTSWRMIQKVLKKAKEIEERLNA